jgi:hypothetical protein
VPTSLITVPTKPNLLARPVRQKERVDETLYKQLVKANVPIAPIHSGLDGGMNRIFLAQIGGSMPPADRSPQPPPVSITDNNGSLASKLFGALFGSKPVSQTQLASATQEGSGDSATSRRNAKPATNIRSVAAAKLNSIKPLNETTTPKSEPQQTAAMQLKPGLQQEANAAPPESDDINVVSALPTVPADSFDSRWHGLENEAPKPQQTAAVQPKPGLQQEVNAASPESDDINVVSALPTVPADSFDSRWHGFQ